MVIDFGPGHVIDMFIVSVYNLLLLLFNLPFVLCELIIYHALKWILKLVYVSFCLVMTSIIIVGAFVITMTRMCVKILQPSAL